jgi:hypothetical protein
MNTTNVGGSTAPQRRALTLVIDEVNGAPCRSAYAFSTRRNPDYAMADLRCREGTVMRTCRRLFQGRHTPWPATNYRQHLTLRRLAWYAQNAIHHLQSLPADVKPGAAEYVWRAPDLVVTPVA